MNQMDTLDQEKAANIPPPVIKKHAAVKPAPDPAAGSSLDTMGPMDAALDAAGPGGDTPTPAPPDAGLDMDAALDAAEGRSVYI